MVSSAGHFDAPKLSRLSQTDNFCQLDSQIADAAYVQGTVPGACLR